ncbi:hypothetical protein [Ruminococcus sp.]|uniref:XAC2610-related protein n=1 Tax=Ruminococcus sp. TaxID=41978 RepID=UPI0025DF3671|nr:hypothetical protein [Ruminococcus sp.]
MKKLILTLSAIMFLSGCSGKNTQGSVSEEDTTTSAQTETTSESTTQTGTDSQSETTESSKIGTLTYISDGNNITFSMNDKECNTVQVESDAEDSYKFHVADYNFDGYEDIFIMTEKFESTGEYYLYAPEKEEFEKSDAFGVLDGKSPLLEVTDDNHLELVTNVMSDYVHNIYAWKDNKVVLVGERREYFQLYYIGDDYICDNYEITEDGMKYLVSREYKDPKTYEIRKTETTLDYFIVKGNSVLVMKGKDIMQEIPDVNIIEMIDEIKAYVDENGAVAPDFEICDPECYLSVDDWDSDGHDDLGIPYDNSITGTGNKYKYYHYIPETGQYVLWDELNALGGKVAKFTSYPTILHVSSRDRENNTSEDYKYKWQDGKLIPFLHLHTHKEDEQNVCDLYEYDENGNEVLVESGDGTIHNDFMARTE